MFPEIPVFSLDRHENIAGWALAGRISWLSAGDQGWGQDALLDLSQPIERARKFRRPGRFDRGCSSTRRPDREGRGGCCSGYCPAIGPGLARPVLPT